LDKSIYDANLLLLGHWLLP